MNTASTRSGYGQVDARTCPYCESLFLPKRKRQDFCGDLCRYGYHKDFGTQGAVAAITRLKRGVSVVIHFPSGPAAERAINLLKGDVVRIVKPS